jgi:glycosyltransferase involved in cell wall biosynthesis
MRLRYLPTLSTKHLEALVHSGAATLATLRGPYDVIHYHGVGPALMTPLARALGRPRVVVTVHALDGERDKWGALAKATLRTGTFLSARVPHATIVPSQALADHLALCYGCEAIYIPNGVRARPPRPPDQITSRLGLDAGRYVLFVGRFVPEKRPHVLINAFRHVPGDVRLVLVGDTSHTDAYTHSIRRAAAIDDRVLLPGFLSGPILEELYSSAAVFVLPSRLEGLPLTVLEAGSYGVPLVLSAIPPHHEIVGVSGPGHRLVPIDDEDALAETIRVVLSALERERLGALKLREHVLRTYRWGEAAEHAVDVYRRVLHLPAMSPPAQIGAPRQPATAASRDPPGYAAQEFEVSSERLGRSP